MQKSACLIERGWKAFRPMPIWTGFLFKDLVFLSCWNVIAWTSWGFGSDNSSVLQSKLIKHRWMSHWNALIDNNQQMWKWSIGQWSCVIPLVSHTVLTMGAKKHVLLWFQLSTCYTLSLPAAAEQQGSSRAAGYFSEKYYRHWALPSTSLSVSHFFRRWEV